MNDRQLVLIGSGGLARETLWALQSQAGVKVLGFVTSDASQHGARVCDLPVLGAEDWLIGRDEVEAVCCIGDPRKRVQLVERLEARGVRFTGAIHPSTEMSEYVEIGAGCIIGARAVLTSQVVLGRHCLIGAGAIVSHDCVLEDFATLAPGVVLAGGVHVAYGAELGAGVAVRPQCRVGRGSLVGAQAAVVGETEANAILAGVPARVLRRFNRDEEL